MNELHPLTLGLLLILTCLSWLLPRRLAVCPLLIMTCLVPLGQQLVIFGLHFFMFRLLLLVGVLRVLIRGEAAQLRLTGLDKIFIWWVIVSIVFGTLSKPSIALLVNRLGSAYDAFTCYFFIRCVIVDFEDFVTSVRTLAFLSLPLAALMLVEKVTTHNLLSVFGGVPEITLIREGRLRCQGAFRHPILAGTFGATQFPLFVALWRYGPQYRRLGVAATIGSLIIAITASSSGALLSLVAGLGGLSLWRWRKYMPLIRWGTFVVVLGLAMVMEAPIWFLFAKLSSLVGGTGWHRAWLIDQAIAHFDEWWLFGTVYTAHWGPAGEVIAANPNMMDITNQYIAEGVKGGVLNLGLFLAIIIYCFRGLRWWLGTEAAEAPVGFFVWAIGASLFAHCLSFMSATYFDQIIIIWYWLLAIIGSIVNQSLPISSRASMISTMQARRYGGGAHQRLISSRRRRNNSARSSKP